jgi:hypothetical protein
LHIFFSFFAFIASKICPSPSIFKTYCNTLVFLQCECWTYAWAMGQGVHNMLTEFKVWNNCLFRQLLTMHFPCCFALGQGPVLSMKHFSICVWNMGYWTKFKDWVTPEVT